MSVLVSASSLRSNNFRRTFEELDSFSSAPGTLRLLSRVVQALSRASLTPLLDNQVLNPFSDPSFPGFGLGKQV
jgi:hypothetical protein